MEPLLLFYDHRQREMAKQATELGENDENSVEKKIQSQHHFDERHGGVKGQTARFVRWTPLDLDSHCRWGLASDANNGFNF